jgi:hypothetical protein
VCNSEEAQQDGKGHAPRLVARDKDTTIQTRVRAKEEKADEQLGASEQGTVRQHFYRAPAHRRTDHNANDTLLRQVAFFGTSPWHTRTHRLSHLLGTHAHTKVSLDLCSLHHNRFCWPRKMAIAARKMTAT